MGLQGQLSDLSSDSIPLLLFAMFATFMGRLRSSVSSFLHSLGLPRRLDRPPLEEEGLFASALGSGLASLQLLAEQLNLNHCFSYRYDRTRRHRDVDAAVSDDCVVCLSTLKDGEDVRMLECRHVFHKECFDGWLDQLNFSCPICRFPLVKEKRVEETRRQVGYDLLNWFSLRAN